MDGSISKKQPAPLFHREIVYRDAIDQRNLRSRVRSEWFEMELVRQGKLPVYKNPSQMNCPGCGFFSICQLR